MSLQEKVLNLKLEAMLALRHASGWQKLIDTHGEQKATEFYKHLGLNHLEAKGFDFEGLTLSREPKEHEKLAVKGIAQAQESSKGQITKVLLSLRQELILDGLERIKKLEPADYHTLILQVPAGIRAILRDRLITTHMRGRILVAQELERQAGKAWMAEGTWQHPVDFDVVHKRNGFGPHGAECNGGSTCKCNVKHWSDCSGTFWPYGGTPSCACWNKKIKEDDEDEFDDLDMLTDVTTSRVVNDVQSRITGSASRAIIAGLAGATLLAAVSTEINAGSVSYIDRSATGLANKVISIGRGDEARRRGGDWERVEYSAILDNNVCGPCASADGESGETEADITPAPNPDCAGLDYCRCFHVFITR